MSANVKPKVERVSADIFCLFILLVEGKDEIYFFVALLCHMYPEATVEITEVYSTRSLQCIVRNVRPGVDIEIREVGGKDQFPKRFPVLLENPSFAQIKAYLIVRDADASAEDTLKSIHSLLKRYNQPCPPQHGTFALSDDGTLKVGIFIMPGAHATIGMLEDLCLLSVNSHPIMPHITDFTVRVKETMKEKSPKNPSKAALQTFLSGMPDHVTSLGLAARSHYWPFDDNAFTCLRDFLAQFIAEVQL